MTAIAGARASAERDTAIAALVRVAAGAASFARRSVGAWPHAAMAAVMAVVMLGPLGAIGSLLGALALVGCSIGCSRRARDSAAFRAHVVDLWAMALLTLAMLPPATTAAAEAVSRLSIGGMAMGRMSTASAGVGSAHTAVLCCAVAVGWLVARALLATRSPHRRHDVVTGVATGCGLALMAMV